MKKLKLKNRSYKILVANYKEWLDILGFAESSVYTFPNYLQEFFYYLEQHHINNIDYINREIVKRYYKYLQERPNEKRGGGLCKSYLNSHQQALKKFKEYLQKHNAKNIPLHLKPERIDRLEIINILTQEEIKELFKATEYSSEDERVQLRDKAMLVLLYSCGLRRNEAVTMNIKDILFDKELILVRKGKNYKERFVPINKHSSRILEEYIYDYRTEFYSYKETESLFINYRGNRLQGKSFANRLEAIIKATENKSLRQRNITLHSLRHSIATHLLEQGANIEHISTFLGHASLESTQIYTHLVPEESGISYQSRKTNHHELSRLLREKRLHGQHYPSIPKRQITL